MAASGCCPCSPTFPERTSPISLWDSEQAYSDFGRRGLSPHLLEETGKDLCVLGAGGCLIIMAAAPAILPPFVHPFIRSLLPFFGLSFISHSGNTAKYSRSWKGHRRMEPWIVPHTDPL